MYAGASDDGDERRLSGASTSESSSSAETTAERQHSHGRDDGEGDGDGVGASTDDGFGLGGPTPTAPFLTRRDTTALARTAPFLTRDTMAYEGGDGDGSGGGQERSVAGNERASLAQHRGFVASPFLPTWDGISEAGSDGGGDDDDDDSDDAGGGGRRTGRGFGRGEGRRDGRGGGREARVSGASDVSRNSFASRYSRISVSRGGVGGQLSTANYSVGSTDHYANNARYEDGDDARQGNVGATGGGGGGGGARTPALRKSRPSMRKSGAWARNNAGSSEGGMRESLALGLGSLRLETSDSDAISGFIGRQSVQKALAEEELARARDPEQRRYGHLADAVAAVVSRDPLALAFMVRQGVDMDAQDQDGRAALHVAAELGDVALVRVLLDLGAAPGVVGLFGLTPAHVAAYCGHVEVLEVLLSAGGDTNARDTDGSTPLHWAVSSGKLAAVKYLAGRNDIDVYATNEINLLALDVSESADVTHALRAAEGGMDLHTLASQGKLPIIRRMLDASEARAMAGPGAMKMVNVLDTAGETLMHRAARGGHARVVEALYWDYGADPDLRSWTDGATPLHLAADGGHVETLNVFCRFSEGSEEMLRKRANARTRRGDDHSDQAGGFPGGSTAIHLAAYQGWTGAVEALLDTMNADIEGADEDGSTPLHLASTRGHAEVVESLIQRGARVEALDAHSCHALHLAVEQGHGAVARRLLRHGGADILARNAQGNMAVHLAAATGRFDMLVGLLPAAEQGDDGARAGPGNIPAMLREGSGGGGSEGEQGRREQEQARGRGRRERVPGTSTGGRGVNVEGYRGWTCLHLAAHGRFLELVQHLLQRPGVDPSPVDISGATPLHLAAVSRGGGRVA